MGAAQFRLPMLFENKVIMVWEGISPCQMSKLKTPSLIHPLLNPHGNFFSMITVSRRLSCPEGVTAVTLSPSPNPKRKTANRCFSKQNGLKTVSRKMILSTGRARSAQRPPAGGIGRGGVEAEHPHLPARPRRPSPLRSRSRLGRPRKDLDFS